MVVGSLFFTVFYIWSIIDINMTFPGAFVSSIKYHPESWANLQANEEWVNKLICLPTLETKEIQS